MSSSQEISVVFEFPLENDAVAVGNCSWIHPPLEGDEGKVREDLDNLVSSSKEIQVNWPLVDTKTKKGTTKLCVAKIRAHGEHRDMCTVRKNLEEFGVCYIPRRDRHQFLSAKNEAVDKSKKKKEKKTSFSKNKGEALLTRKLKRTVDLLQRQKDTEKVKRQKSFIEDSTEMKENTQVENNVVSKPNILKDLTVILDSYTEENTPTPPHSPKFRFSVQDILNEDVAEDSNNSLNKISAAKSPISTAMIENANNHNDDYGYNMAMMMTKMSPFRPTPRTFVNDALTTSHLETQNNNDYPSSLEQTVHADQVQSEMNYPSCDEKDLKTENEELKKLVENQQKEIERLKTLLDTENTVSNVINNLQQALFLSRSCISYNSPRIGDSQEVPTNDLTFNGHEENSSNLFYRCSHASVYKFVYEALATVFSEEQLANSTLTGEAHGVQRKSGWPRKLKLDENKIKEIRDYAEKFVSKSDGKTFEKDVKKAIKKKCNNAHTKLHKVKPESGAEDY